MQVPISLLSLTRQPRGWPPTCAVCHCIASSLLGVKLVSTKLGRRSGGATIICECSDTCDPTQVSEFTSMCVTVDAGTVSVDLGFLQEDIALTAGLVSRISLVRSDSGYDLWVDEIDPADSTKEFSDNPPDGYELVTVLVPSVEA